MSNFSEPSLNELVLTAVETTGPPVVVVDLGSYSDSDDSSILSVLYNDGLLWSYGRIALFALLFRLLDWCVLMPIVNRRSARLSEHRRWRIRNEGTSLIHALISGSWAVGNFAFFPEMWGNMINFYNPYAYCSVLLSVGYLVQDAFDLVLHERSFRIIELLFHHVSIIFACMCCVITRRFTPLVSCGLLMEVNSIFLHSRSLCNLHAVDKLRFYYRFISVANVATFIVLRLSNNVFLIVWDCLNFVIMPPFFFGVLFFVMFSMLIVNTILFYRVLLADAYLQPDFYAGCWVIPWQHGVGLAARQGLDRGLASLRAIRRSDGRSEPVVEDTEGQMLPDLPVASDDQVVVIVAPDGKLSGDEMLYEGEYHNVLRGDEIEVIP